MRVVVFSARWLGSFVLKHILWARGAATGGGAERNWYFLRMDWLVSLRLEHGEVAGSVQGRCKALIL